MTQTTTTANTLGSMIAKLCESGLGLGNAMAADIDAAIFASQPTGKDGQTINTNHPAFNYGHLAIYPARVLEMCGLDAASAAAPAGYEDLFKAGVECRNDPSRTIYPKKDEIMAAYTKGYTALIQQMPKVSDERLAAINPREGRFRDMCPTIGHAAMFLATSHIMMHLGQVSTWRRCFGLKSVM